MRVLAYWLVLGGVVLGCHHDPVQRARQVFPKDPQKALSLLEGALQERPDCFECLAWLGAVREHLKDLPGAAEAYRKAAALPEAKTRTEPVVPRLWTVLEQMFQAAADEESRLALAREAAPLEADLKVARPWANLFLLETIRSNLASLAGAGKTGPLKEALEQAMGLYLPAETKKTLADQGTEWLREAFVVRSRNAFSDGALSERLSREKHWDPSAGEVVLSHRFRIPSAREDARFDPRSGDFWVNVRREACLPLRDQLETLVQAIREPLGLREPQPADLDWIFAEIFQKARAGYVQHGPRDRNPAGEEWLCEVRLPLDALLQQVFRLSE